MKKKGIHSKVMRQGYNNNIQAHNEGTHIHARIPVPISAPALAAELKHTARLLRSSNRASTASVYALVETASILGG
jgi:hypothetical protein